MMEMRTTDLEVRKYWENDGVLNVHRCSVLYKERRKTRLIVVVSQVCAARIPSRCQGAHPCPVLSYLPNLELRVPGQLAASRPVDVPRCGSRSPDVGPLCTYRQAWCQRPPPQPPPGVNKNLLLVYIQRLNVLIYAQYRWIFRVSIAEIFWNIAHD